MLSFIIMLIKNNHHGHYTSNMSYAILQFQYFIRLPFDLIYDLFDSLWHTLDCAIYNAHV